MNWLRIKYRIKKRLRRHCIHCGGRLKKYRIYITYEDKMKKIKRCFNCGKMN